MNKKAILYGIIGLVSGIVLATIFITFIQPGDTTTTQESENVHMMSNENMNDSMTMSSMVDNLKGKTGDDFDNAFIGGMIEHHQGAIDMANLAKKYAGHDEIKAMADDIISAQTAEINQMQEWQRDWGYTK